MDHTSDSTRANLQQQVPLKQQGLQDLGGVGSSSSTQVPGVWGQRMGDVGSQIPLQGDLSKQTTSGFGNQQLGGNIPVERGQQQQQGLGGLVGNMMGSGSSSGLSSGTSGNIPVQQQGGSGQQSWSSRLGEAQEGLKRDIQGGLDTTKEKISSWSGMPGSGQSGIQGQDLKVPGVSSLQSDVGGQQNFGQQQQRQWR